MKKILLFLSLLLIFGSSSNAATTTTKIPLRDFFRTEEGAWYKISPDGKMLSFTAPYKSRTNIFVQPTDLRTEAQRITEIKDREIFDYYWKDDSRIIYFKDIDGDENYHLFVVNVQTKETTDLTPFEGVDCEMLDLLDGVSEDEVLVIMNKENTEAFDVYRLNIKTSDLELIVKNPGNVINWATDHNGVVRVAFTKDGTNDSVYYRDTEEQSFKKIITTTFKEKFFSIVFTSDNKDIYALSDRGRDKIALVKYNINEDKEDEILFQHQDVDVDSFSYSKKHGTLSSVDYYTWKLEHVFFDKERKAIFDYISTQLPSDMVVEFITSDQDESLFIIKAYSDKVPNSYYLYNDKTKELKKLADSRPWLDSDNMSDTKPIQYKSRDALTINGYLTLPAGKDPKKLPVVVVVHGGPEARDTWGFDPEIQFLANRGYAVLQVNYRGSTGYGRSFWESSFKQWGLKMQDDLTDGVQWLINQGVADPSRIAIYGGSYGGYAALAGVTFTPDLYACAVDYVGVSNFFTFFEAAPAYWKPILEMMYEEMGDPVKDKELLTQISPLFHVDKIKVPVFIAQGAQDPRVNKKESDQIVQALKNRHIKVEYMVKMDEGHGFLNEENKLEFYKRAEKFLGQCLAAPKN